MRALLDALERRSWTLTVYDFAGTDEQLRSLTGWLHSYGVGVRTAGTAGSGPDNVGVFHREGEVLGACSVDDLLARSAFESAVAGENSPHLPEPLSSLQGEVTVKPNRSVREMIRISREFERRALRQESGRLHAGFQHLSQIADSDRTLDMYTTLARKGVDVWVYGYPDVSLEDVPFTVIADTDRAFERHWFLLYDGGGNPERKAALVSEECINEDQPTAAEPRTDTDEMGSYDSFFTTDPETVDDLFDIAHEEHGDVFAEG